MRHANLLTIALLALSPFALASFAGCGEEGGTGGASTSSSTTGTGGSGGIAAEPAGHLLISEVAVDPGAAEFIEIWNPTDTAVDLSNYYLSDNAVYYKIMVGDDWMPTGTAGIDFLAQFPAGTTIAPGAYLVLATDAEFEAEFQRCADFRLTEAPVPCGGGDVPSMVAPATTGALGTSATGLLTNDDEMLILFHWDGTDGASLKDVDYVAWGKGVSVSQKSDKTGKMGFLPDTPVAMQRPAPVPGPRQSISRCNDDLEPGEILEGSNGINGHDETSEALDVSFVVTAAMTPGEKNNCGSM